MSESLLGCISETREFSELQAERELEILAKVKAREIVEAGRTFKYIYGVWQRRHHRDAPLGKALLYSLGSQSDPARFPVLEIWEHHLVRKEGDRRS